MADEYSDQEFEGGDEQQPTKRLGSLLATLALVVVIIFIILMLRSCGEKASGEGSATGGKTIEAVEGYVPVDGAVSVWISESSKIDDVISVAGVKATDYVDMGGGKYILDVTPGTEDEVINALQQIKGCYDAGKVYETPK